MTFVSYGMAKSMVQVRRSVRVISETLMCVSTDRVVLLLPIMTGKLQIQINRKSFALYKKKEEKSNFCKSGRNWFLKKKRNEHFSIR